MKTRTALSFAAAAAVAALALASCATAAPGTQAAPPSSSTSAAAVAPQGSVPASGSGDNAAGGSSAPTVTGKDALALKGPALAQTVPDVTAAVKNPRPKLPATVTDSTGKKITVAKTDRLLALDLYGTLTDTVIGLGLQKSLVGRSNSDTQAALKDLPVVTQDGHDLNTEAVLNLRPSLILTNTTIGSEDKYRQLESAGVTVVRFESTPSLDTIDDAIDEVGDALGLPQAAQELADRTERELEAAKATVSQLKANTPVAPRGLVLYVRGTAGVFFILGKDYGAGDIVTALGLEDAAAKNGITQLKPANAEALVSLDPQVVLAMKDGVESTGGVEGLIKRQGMAATTAGANQRIITAADGQLLSYGPRTPANLVSLATAIYTEGK
ncbi:heme/hemin ABC transporter substrate-binding protein [Galactobacter caseinivorans]|uniref:heme/hemin ABC transporter substrate-binding protein n=1 Tax=Galactobacter caseinivorans TaxID=2676123 RepID=UPI00131418D3|nr:ABC transporter substrate-binding protein [Galactobacter caseinivorans]